MENRRLSVMLRRIEKSLESLDTPTVCGATINGSIRSISPTAKIRELENLTQKLMEAQTLVADESQQSWLDGVKETLKARLETVFNPPVIRV